MQLRRLPVDRSQEKEDHGVRSDRSNGPTGWDVDYWLRRLTHHCGALLLEWDRKCRGCNAPVPPEEQFRAFVWNGRRLLRAT
jgi:hypothetical protein